MLNPRDVRRMSHRDPNPAQRVRTLESLRSGVRENKGQLAVGNLKRLFQTLTLCLADSDYHITLQALGLLADIAPDSRHDVGTFIPFLMVSFIPALCGQYACVYYVLCFGVDARDTVLFSFLLMFGWGAFLTMCPCSRRWYPTWGMTNRPSAKPH